MSYLPIIHGVLTVESSLLDAELVGWLFLFCLILVAALLIMQVYFVRPIILFN